MLFLFPRTYRQEYGSELQGVFELSLDDALKQGSLEVLRGALHELLSLPEAILIQHLRKRRKGRMLRKFGAYFNFRPGSGYEFFTALYPFLLMGFVLPIMNALGQAGIIPVPNLFFNGVAIVLLTLMGLLLVIGLATGLPRWSLPYAGFLLSLLSAYGLGSWLNQRHFIPFTALYARSWLLGQIVYQGSLWAGLTLISAVLVLVFGLIPIFRRFKKDWTLLAFLLYGATPFVLVSSFDDYVHEEPYELIAFLILIFGMWSYLHANNPRWQFWMLFGGMTAALFFAAVGKAILGLSQPWFHGNQIDWWGHEMMTTIIMWMWIALSMLVPLVLSLLSEKEEALTPREI